jgi:hypothetical protein
MGISSESDDIRDESSEGSNECAVPEARQSQIEDSHRVILGYGSRQVSQLQGLEKLEGLQPEHRSQARLGLHQQDSHVS